MRNIFRFLITLAIVFPLDAVVAAGQNDSATITVIKTTQGGDGIFQFVGSGPNGFDFGNGFTVTTTSGTSDPGNNAVFTELESGSYSLVEIAGVSWDLSSATCSGDDDGSDPASITLDPSEHVICTFHNIRRGSIEVVKKITHWTELSPKPPSKTFTFDAGGEFRFDGVGGYATQTSLTPVDESTGSTTGPIEVIPGGAYSVTEQNPWGIGWSLIASACNNGSDPVIAVDVTPGEAVVCTFINTPTLLLPLFIDGFESAAN